MAGTAEKPSFWEQALNTYRDVEIAKRSQPQLVQGIQQVQTPLARNSGASLGGVGESMSNIVPGGSKTLLLLGGGLLAVAAVVMLVKKRR